MKTKNEVLAALETKVTAKELGKLKGLQFNALVKKYEQILKNELAVLGMNESTLNSYSIEKLTALSNKLAENKQQSETANNDKQPHARQIAVINAVNSGLTFPCDYDKFVDVVTANYAPKYFDMKGNNPQSIDAVRTLFDFSEIETLNGTDIKTAMFELLKNGKFAAQNSYSPKHVRSSHNHPAFPFKLSKVGNVIEFESK